MNNKCLSVDEMLSLLMCDQLSDESKIQMFSISEHLIHCNKCIEIYRKLSRMYDTLENWTLQSQFETEQKLLHLKTAHSLLLTKSNAMPGVAARIDSWIYNFIECSAKISVKIKEKIQIASDQLSLLVSESSPMSFTYAQTATRGQETELDETLLIDNNNALNQIKIDEDKRIQIALEMPIDAVSPLIALVPKDSAKPAQLVGLTYNTVNSRWEATIERPDSGEYDLIIESQGE